MTGLMTARSWLECWPVKVVKKAVVGFKQHGRHRIGRRIKRGAGALVSKPAAVVWVCAAVGGIGWLAWPEQPVSAGGPPPVTPLSTGAGTPMLAPGMFAFAPPVEMPPQIAFPPETRTPVPEPASLALLIPALAALAAWRFRP